LPFTAILQLFWLKNKIIGKTQQAGVCADGEQANGHASRRTMYRAYPFSPPIIR
jgi:hypothetical protein